VNLYRKMHKDFFFAAASLRNTYGIQHLSSDHIFAGKWLTEDEIEDFTLAYMQGGEL
jgi:adenylate kinase family enzyme